MKTKFFFIAVVAIMVTFQGFAQKVNPWLRGDNNKSTEEIRRYYLDGVAPEGIATTIPHSEIIRAIEQSFGSINLQEDWRVVIARSKCIDPPVDLTKRTILFWGSLGEKARYMEEPRHLKKGEKIFVDPVTNTIIAGGICGNLLVTPMPWSDPLCEPETSLDGYSTADESSSSEEEQRSSLKVTDRTTGNNGGQSKGSNSSSTSSSSSDSGSKGQSRSNDDDDDCTWCGLEGRDGYIRKKDVLSYIELRNQDVRETNDEYIRVKEAESRIRRDDMFNMMYAKNMCNDCQPTGQAMQYGGNEYYEVRQGNENAWLAPALGGFFGGMAGSGLMTLILDRNGRPTGQQQWGGWQQQQRFYGHRGLQANGSGYVPNNGGYAQQQVDQWEQNPHLRPANLPNGGRGYQ